MVTEMHIKEARIVQSNQAFKLNGLSYSGATANTT